MPEYVIALIEYQYGDRTDSGEVEVKGRKLVPMQLPVPAGKSPEVFAISLWRTGIIKQSEEDELVESIPPRRIYSLNWQLE